MEANVNTTTERQLCSLTHQEGMTLFTVAFGYEPVPAQFSLTVIGEKGNLVSVSNGLDTLSVFVNGFMLPYSSRGTTTHRGFHARRVLLYLSMLNIQFTDE